MDKYLLALLFIDLAEKLLANASTPDPTPEQMAASKQKVADKLDAIKERLDADPS